MEVQARVAEYIQDQGLKKYKVSELSGIKLSRLSKLLNCKTDMRADELQKICKALKVSPSKFIDAKKKNE